jgi:hypothetical protein
MGFLISIYKNNSFFLDKNLNITIIAIIILAKKSKKEEEKKQ